MSELGSPAAIPARARARRPAVLAAFLLLYVALGAFVFLSGRTHTVIIDYAATEDGSAPAVEQVTIYVGRSEGIEYTGGDFRDQVLVKGQRQQLAIESFFGGEKIVRDFSIPVGADLILLSVPKAAAGIEPFVSAYVAPKRMVSAEDPNEGSSSFTSPAPGESPAVPGLDGPAVVTAP